MRNNRVAMGAFLLVALLGLTIWALQTRDNAPTNNGASSSLPDIDRDALTEISITRADEAPVLFARTNDTWRITSPVEADVDTNAINTVLERIGSLQSMGIVATNAENHARLEVDDAKAVVVQARTKDGVAGVLRVGKYSGGKTMVRVGDSSEVHGVKGSVRYAFDRDLKNWRNRKVVNEKDAEVQAISFEQGKNSLAFDLGANGEWEQRAGQKKIKDFDPKQVAGFVSTVARLTATDFVDVKTTAAKAGLDNPTATVRFVVQPKPEAKPSSATDGGVAKEVAPTEPLPARTITLKVGGPAEGEARFYLQREGSEPTYIISRYIAERLQPTRDKFKKAKTNPNAKPAMPAANPGGMPAMPTGPDGKPQLPPEIMKQLQEQLKAQGKHP